MRTNIKERIIGEALYIKNTHSTVRNTAIVFDVSKSTVHLDISQKLQKINKKLYIQVKKIMMTNFNEKHIRGGEATKKKYLNKKYNND